MDDIEITIDELLLGSVNATQAQQIGQIVTRELQRLVTQQGLTARNSHHATLSVPVHHWQPDATPDQVGTLIAQAVYSVLLERQAFATALDCQDSIMKIRLHRATQATQPARAENQLFPAQPARPRLYHNIAQTQRN
ncbi:MAG: hypothetical protein R2932_50910 [Caldilineaceae bacterium]